MSAPRLICSAAVFCGFVLYGAVRAERKKAALSEAEALRKDLAELSDRMELTRSHLCAICEELSRKSGLSELWSAMTEGLSKGLAPSEAFALCRGTLKNEAAAAVIKELFEDLGSADIEKESGRLELSLKKLDELISFSRGEFEKSRRLTSSLSVLMGLAAALILL